MAFLAVIPLFIIDMKFKQVQLSIPPNILFQKEQIQNKEDLFILESQNYNSLKMIQGIQKLDIYENEEVLIPIINFYKQQRQKQISQRQQSNSIALPILNIKNTHKNKFKTLTVLFAKQGITFSDVRQYQFQTFQTQVLKQFKLLIQSLKNRSFFPILNAQNIYLQQFQETNKRYKIKIAPSDAALDEKHFVQKLKLIMLKIVKSDKQLKDKLKNVQSILQILSLCDSIQQKNEQKQQNKNLKRQKMKEKFSIKNISHEWQIYEKHHQKSISSPKIQISQEKFNTIMKLFDIQLISKEFILSGKDIHFNPVALHKKIQDKGPLLYIIEADNGHKIAFLTYFKLQKKFQPIFGTYFQDQKALLYDFQTSNVFQAKDKNYSIGYGPEIFLIIGKLDIVISAYNINNYCHFPYSYQKKDNLEKGQQIHHEEQEIITQHTLFQKQFVVKNLDIYHIKEKQKQKESINQKQKQKQNPKPKQAQRQKQKTIQKPKPKQKAIQKPKPKQKASQIPKNKLKDTSTVSVPVAGSLNINPSQKQINQQLLNSSIKQRQKSTSKPTHINSTKK